MVCKCPLAVEHTRPAALPLLPGGLPRCLGQLSRRRVRRLNAASPARLRQQDEVKTRGERAIRKDVLVRQHGLSNRQVAARGHIIEHGRLTIRDYKRLRPGRNRRTLQRDVRMLVEKGLLYEAGAAQTDPTLHYRLPDGIEGSGAEP